MSGATASPSAMHANHPLVARNFRCRRGEIDRGLVDLDALDSRRSGIEADREEFREILARARSASQAAQLAARDLMVRFEGRRSTEGSMEVGLRRMIEQRSQLLARVTELERDLVVVVEFRGDKLAAERHLLGSRERAAPGGPRLPA